MLYGNEQTRKDIFIITPMIWRAPNADHDNCYACKTDIYKKRFDQRHAIKYFRNSSSILAVKKEVMEPSAQESTTDGPVSSRIRSKRESSNQRSNEPLPGPSNEVVPPINIVNIHSNISELTSASSITISQSSSEGYQPYTIQKKLEQRNQAELNDLCRDLKLTIEQSEILGSRLNQWSYLKPGVSIGFRSRSKEIQEFYKEENEITYCNDINGLFKKFNTVHNPNEWRLFIDSSTESLKAVLLHNGNLKPTIPIAYSTKHKENYEAMRLLLHLIKYEEFKWNVVGDFKIIAILSGLKGGHSKYPCSWCLFDSRAPLDKRYATKNWPVRNPNTPGNTEDGSRINSPLVPADKLIFPLLHIKQGLCKQLIKVLVKENPEVLPKIKQINNLSNWKIEEGVFTGPEIRNLFNSDFHTILSKEQKAAWNSFKLVCTSFLGNERDKNYKKLVENLIKCYKKLNVSVSLKVHCLISHLDAFPVNCGAFSDEQGERAHQDLKNIEKRFKGKNYAHALADYCWLLCRETNPNQYNRQVRTRTQYFLISV